MSAMSSALLQSSFVNRGAQRAFLSCNTSNRNARISAFSMTTKALSQDELKQQVKAPSDNFHQNQRFLQPGVTLFLLIAMYPILFIISPSVHL